MLQRSTGTCTGIGTCGSTSTGTGDSIDIGTSSGTSTCVGAHDVDYCLTKNGLVRLRDRIYVPNLESFMRNHIQVTQVIKRH